MNETVRGRLRTLLFTLIGFAVMVGLIWYVGPEKLLASVLSVSPSWLCLSVVFTLLFFILRAIRWTLLLRPVKNAVLISNAFWVTLIGYMANFVSGTRVGGEFLRAILMRLREDIGFVEGFSSVCVERVLDLLGIVAIGVISLSFFPANMPLPEWFMDSLRVVGTFVLVAIVGLIAGTRKERALAGLLDRTLTLIRIPEKWRMRLLDFFKALIVGARGISTDLPSLMVIFFLTLTIWTLQALSVYAMFVAFGLSLSLGLAFLGTMILQLTFILPSPPGLAGTYEGAFAGIFVTLGLTLGEVLPLSLLNHFVYFSLILVLGWVGMVKMDISLQQLRSLLDQQDSSDRVQ